MCLNSLVCYLLQLKDLSSISNLCFLLVPLRSLLELPESEEFQELTSRGLRLKFKYRITEQEARNYNQQVFSNACEDVWAFMEVMAEDEKESCVKREKLVAIVFAEEFFSRLIDIPAQYGFVQADKRWPPFPVYMCPVVAPKCTKPAELEYNSSWPQVSDVEGRINLCSSTKTPTVEIRAKPTKKYGTMVRIFTLKNISRSIVALIPFVFIFISQFSFLGGKISKKALMEALEDPKFAKNLSSIQQKIITVSGMIAMHAYTLASELEQPEERNSLPTPSKKTNRRVKPTMNRSSSEGALIVGLEQEKRAPTPAVRQKRAKDRLDKSASSGSIASEASVEGNPTIESSDEADRRKSAQAAVDSQFTPDVSQTF